MGLYARVDLSEFEESAGSVAASIGSFVVDLFDSVIEGIDSGTGPEDGGVQWDGMDDVSCDFSGAGSEVAAAFAEGFMQAATAACPVRTGYLQGSIRCDAGGAEAECYAGAEYAQYVEYGTSKMGAQPYFEPGIEAGLEAARAAGQSKIQEMADQFSSALEASIDSGVDGIDGFSIAGAIAAAILAAILYALIETLVEQFIEEMTSSLDSSLSNVDIMAT